MVYDLNIPEDLYKFKVQSESLIRKGALVELKETKLTRSLRQNNSIWLYCQMIAETLNELGEEFTFIGIKGIELKTRYTKELVKETLWVSIQQALFNKESTTELTRNEVSEVADVIERYFAERGINLPFPSREYLDG